MYRAVVSAPPDLVRFDAVTAWLAEHRAVWQSRPFTQERVAWEAAEPALAAWCRARTPDEVEALERGGGAAPLPEPLAGWWRTAAALTALPRRSEPPLPHDHATALAVPGRKWAQLQALGGVAAPLAAEAGRVVDWCAGKGHLGRTLAGHVGASLVAVERDGALVVAGRALATQRGVRAEFIEADVLDAPLAGVARGAVVVALHACGVLTDAALDRARADGARGLVVSPCCYHRTPELVWRPRSAAGRARDLGLHRDALRLPSAEETCAGRRRRRARRRELDYRQGLDLLRRAATGDPRYRPLPSCPRAWLADGFAPFVARMAAAHAVPLPARWDPYAAEAAGRARAHAARALGLPRAAFRRAVEVWLLLDRAFALQEAGWDVTLGRFCARHETPRDLSLVARPG